MDVLVGWFWALEYWHWWALGLGLLALEVFIASTILIWPAVGCFVIGGILAVAPDLDWRLQVLALALVSVAAAFGWEYGFARRRTAAADRPDLNVRTARYLGRRTVLDVSLRDGSGRIRLDDSMWQVRSESGDAIAAGTAIEVVGADGATLLVRPVSTPD